MKQYIYTIILCLMALLSHAQSDPAPKPPFSTVSIQGFAKISAGDTIHTGYQSGFGFFNIAGRSWVTKNFPFRHDSLTAINYSTFLNQAGQLAQIPYLTFDGNEFTFSKSLYINGAQTGINFSPPSGAAGNYAIIAQDDTTLTLYRSGHSGTAVDGQITAYGNNLKDGNGIRFAKMSDIPSMSGYIPYSGATSGIDLGSQAITSTGGHIIFSGSGSVITHSFMDSGSIFVTSSNGNVLNIYSGYTGNPSLVYQFSTGYGFLKWDNITNSRTLQLPDNSGIIALTSDIPSVTGYVPYTGASTDIQLGNHYYYTNYAFLAGPPSGANAANFNQNSINFNDASTSLQAIYGRNYFEIYDPTSGFQVQINPNTSMTSKANLTLPAQSGTIALLSDVSTNYVPYSGSTSDLNIGAHIFTSINGADHASIGYNVGGGTPSADFYHGSAYASYRYNQVNYSDGTNTLYLQGPSYPLGADHIQIIQNKTGTIANTNDNISEFTNDVNYQIVGNMQSTVTNSTTQYPTGAAVQSYVSSQISGGAVTSLAGTPNQVVVSSSTGAVTLSLPQNIATSSTPTFAAQYLTNNSSTPTFTGSSGTVLFSLNNRLTYENLSTEYVRSEYSNYAGTSTIKFPNLATTTLADSAQTAGLLAAKQASGNYITALNGDATASGPGSVVLTLATVNSNIGTFNNVTVNGKGLVTAASNISYQAPLSGTGYIRQSGTSTSYIATIPNSDLTNSTISGVALGSNLPVLTLGTGLTGTSYNGSTAITATVDQTFSPTWTGNHTFNNSITANGGVTVGAPITPSANSAYDLGTSSLFFNNIWGIKIRSSLYTATSSTNGLQFQNTSGNTQFEMFNSTGDWTLQNSGTFTDGGYKLDLQTAGTNGYFRVGSTLIIGTTGTFSQSGPATFGNTTSLGATLGVSTNLTTATVSSSVGRIFSVQAGTILRTADAGTIAQDAISSFAIDALQANSATTYTNASTLYIDGAPTASTNVTIANPYALYVNTGSSYFGGSVSISGSGTTLAVTGNSTISGALTTGSIYKSTAATTINANYTGWGLATQSATYTDNFTAASNTTALAAINGFNTPTISTTNTGVTYTNASTVYIGGAPIAGSNSPTFTNAYAMYINGGASYFGGTIYAPGNFSAAAGNTSNFFVVGGNGVTGTQTTSNLLFAGASSIQAHAWFNGIFSTTLAANTSAANVIVAGTPFTTSSTTGTHSLLANLVVQPVGTITAGTGTVTNTAALYIAGNSSATVTGANMGLWATGNTRLDLGSDATGDIFYRGSNNTLTRLPIGSAGQILTVSGSTPSWSKGINYLNGRTAISDVNYTQLSTDYLIAYTTLTSARTVSLIAINDNQTVLIKDESGNAASYNITINAPSGKLIDGVSSKTINTNMGSVKLYYQASSGNYFTY